MTLDLAQHSSLHIEDKRWGGEGGGWRDEIPNASMHSLPT